MEQNGEAKTKGGWHENNSEDEQGKEKKKRSKQEEEQLKVLVVDDSEFTRKKIIDILEKEKIQIVGEAGLAQEAMGIIQCNKPNLMILDVVMPDIGGIEFAKFVHEKFPLLQIILISSLKHEHIIWEAISVGAIDFLPKPFPPQQLIDAVNKVQSLLEKK